MQHIAVYIDLFLRVFSIVYLIFDGTPPKSKEIVIRDRQSNQQKYNNPKKTPEIVEEIIEKYKNLSKIKIVISPQESDPQLAYMSLKGQVDFLITEDSDLIVYGCDRIIFKLKPRGDCLVYKRERFENFLKRYNWDFVTFKMICILCGCDYLKGGIKGLGFFKARKIFKKPFENELELKEFLKIQFGVSDEFFQNFKVACESYTNQIIKTPTNSGPFNEMLLKNE